MLPIIVYYLFNCVPHENKHSENGFLRLMNQDSAYCFFHPQNLKTRVAIGLRGHSGEKMVISGESYF